MSLEARTQKSPSPGQADYEFTIRPDLSPPQNLEGAAFVDYDAQAQIAEFARSECDSEDRAFKASVLLFRHIESSLVWEYVLDALRASDPRHFTWPSVRAAAFDALAKYSDSPEVAVVAAQEFSRQINSEPNCASAFQILSATTGDARTKITEICRTVVEEYKEQKQGKIDPSSLPAGVAYALKVLGKLPSTTIEDRTIAETMRDYFASSTDPSILDRIAAIKTDKTIRLLMDIAKGSLRPTISIDPRQYLVDSESMISGFGLGAFVGTMVGPIVGGTVYWNIKPPNDSPTGLAWGVATFIASVLAPLYIPPLKEFIKSLGFKNERFSEHALELLAVDPPNRAAERILLHAMFDEKKPIKLRTLLATGLNKSKDPTVARAIVGGLAQGTTELKLLCLKALAGRADEQSCEAINKAKSDFSPEVSTEATKLDRIAAASRVEGL